MQSEIRRCVYVFKLLLKWRQQLPSSLGCSCYLIIIDNSTDSLALNLNTFLKLVCAVPAGIPELVIPDPFVARVKA